MVATYSVDGLEGAVDRAARGERRHHGHEYDLQSDRQIAGYSDGKITEQPRNLIACGVASDPSFRCFQDREQNNGYAAADSAAFEAKNEEVPLKLAGDKGIRGPDIVQ